MNRMPNWLKWLVILFVFVILAVLMLAVNDRASRVDMPEPDRHLSLGQRERSCIKGSSQKALPLFHGRALFC